MSGAHGLAAPGTFALPTSRLPFLGCFHVPRCLAMCEEMLGALLSRLTPDPGAPCSPPADSADGGAE